jgi:hypothetical protein
MSIKQHAADSASPPAGPSTPRCGHLAPGIGCLRRRSVQLAQALVCLAAFNLSGCGDALQDVAREQDPAAESGPTGADASRASSTAQQRLQPAVNCSFDGAWALKFTIPVQWSGNMGVRAGSGNIVQYLRSQRHTEGQSVIDALQVCGSHVPDYRTNILAGNELFGVRFDEAQFDRNTQVHGTLISHLSDFSPQATYSTDWTAIQLGVSLADPIVDAWPHSYRDLKEIIDADGDDNPGLTVSFSDAPGYSNPPTLFSRQKRARFIFTAVRNVARSSGQAVSCDRFEGTAEVPYIEGVFAVNAHALGCIKEDGSKCTVAETSLLDKYEPSYAPAGQATVVMQRMPEGATCADARAAFP